ncbi:MAG TPA: Maf family protein [Acetobacteraceae bacterium]|nr:Maf family protein [Acetobacteraceae bacterium]
MLQSPYPQLILASASRARSSVLAGAGLSFQVEAARVDEAAVKQSARAEGAGVDETALILAELKAGRVSERVPEALVIGADQILVCEGAWFDKPADLPAAWTQLLALRGKTHVLSTAVVVQRRGQRLWQHVARPRLTMREFTDAFLDAYLAAEQVRLLTSVGAYRLEGRGVHLFEQIEGDYSAILGLPLLPLLAFLRQHGMILE